MYRHSLIDVILILWAQNQININQLIYVLYSNIEKWIQFLVSLNIRIDNKRITIGHCNNLLLGDHMTKTIARHSMYTCILYILLRINYDSIQMRFSGEIEDSSKLNSFIAKEITFLTNRDKG